MRGGVSPRVDGWELTGLRVDRSEVGVEGSPRVGKLGSPRVDRSES